MTQAFPWAVAAHRGLASGEALNMGVGMVGVLKYPFFFSLTAGRGRFCPYGTSSNDLSLPQFPHLQGGWFKDPWT